LGDKGDNKYKLDEPGEFNFRKFVSFCDAVTDGVAPFERIDCQSEAGKNLEEIVQGIYKEQCKKFVSKNAAIINNMQNDNYQGPKFDFIMKSELVRYQADADDDLKRAFYKIKCEESFFIGFYATVALKSFIER